MKKPVFRYKLEDDGLMEIYVNNVLMSEWMCEDSEFAEDMMDDFKKIYNAGMEIAMSKDEINVGSVFELVEHTNEEAYHPIGIYKTYEEAKSVIEEADLYNRPIYGYDDDDTEIIKIFERRFGESENGDEVYCCNRENFYNEEYDECRWITIKNS